MCGPWAPGPDATYCSDSCFCQSLWAPYSFSNFHYLTYCSGTGLASSQPREPMRHNVGHQHGTAGSTLWHGQSNPHGMACWGQDCWDSTAGGCMSLQCWRVHTVQCSTQPLATQKLDSPDARIRASSAKPWNFLFDEIQSPGSNPSVFR